MINELYLKEENGLCLTPYFKKDKILFKESSWMPK